jgi:hypothetical protein
MKFLPVTNSNALHFSGSWWLLGVSDAVYIELIYILKKNCIEKKIKFTVLNAAS